MRTPMCVRLVVWIALSITVALPAGAQGAKMGPLADRAANSSSGFSPVIIQAADGTTTSQLAAVIQQFGGSPGRALGIINAHAATMPNAALKALAGHGAVAYVALDRPTVGAMERTRAAIGATAVRQQFGYDGSGVGVALVDSGVASWHDDLSSGSGGQRIAAFVDFVNGRTSPYDDYGHGTHVAGIVAGNGYDSSGARAGIAPGASLVVLKTLDANGAGRISSVIAAFDYILAHKDALNIRVVNLSLSAGVFESYNTDPLTRAAKRLVDAGIVVVAAAGNVGVDAQGAVVYGGITAPGNAPWVLTVGADSHAGTVDRADDLMSTFSSRGPSPVDVAAKPDVVAPGVGIESIIDPTSTLYATHGPYLLDGTVTRPYHPYLSLSGTSMATPVVSATVALMLQANPALEPNAVKAIVQYTSQIYPQYNRLTQGVGFVNAKGAVDLARSLNGLAGSDVDTAGWSRQLLWGNHLLRGGSLRLSANAWARGVTWGAALTPAGQPTAWGVLAGSGAPWSVSCADAACGTVLSWGPASRNVVWGAACGGDNCATSWSPIASGGAVATVGDNEIVVWGSADNNEIVVWGSSGELDIVVWGSDCTTCEPVLWSN